MAKKDAITLLLPFFFTLLLSACNPPPQSGPPSTRTRSSQLATLQAKADFLHKYVNFRRTYELLDFDIFYQNGGDGGVPSPSEWDIRVVALVPQAEITSWIPTGATLTTTAPDHNWLKTVSTSLNLSGVDEWFVDGHRIIGIDRQNRIVVYRNWAN